jgi:hypothetical protein
MLRKSSRVILDSSGKGSAPLAPFLPLSEIKPTPLPPPLAAPVSREGSGK